CKAPRGSIRRSVSMEIVPAPSAPCDFMRRLALFALALALVVGCSKKKPTEPAQPEAKPAPKPADTTDADRARLLTQLKTTNERNRLDAIEELSIWAETDPPTVAALLELLRDKSTAGSG